MTELNTAPPERNPQLGHRCFDQRVQGIIRYNPHRPIGYPTEWCACIELDDSLAFDARARFASRHGIALEPPAFGFHMTLFRGPVDRTAALQRSWASFEGERVDVLLTRELFWKDRFVWFNAHCDHYRLLRETLAGLDDSDPELWGHATIGTFPNGFALPRFLDYRDFPDWGFRP